MPNSGDKRERGDFEIAPSPRNQPLNQPIAINAISHAKKWRKATLRPCLRRCAPAPSSLASTSQCWQSSRLGLCCRLSSISSSTPHSFAWLCTRPCQEWLRFLCFSRPTTGWLGYRPARCCFVGEACLQFSRRRRSAHTSCRFLQLIQIILSSCRSFEHPRFCHACYPCSSSTLTSASAGSSA